MEQNRTDDPFRLIEGLARDLALRAMETGWQGPPYDPFKLADELGIEVVARQDLDDARLVAEEGRPRIEFNPHRRPARVRFSVAHEIGHTLFDDYADRARYRDLDERRGDDWQLEALCNVAAAELLMPAGALPIAESDDLDLVRLLGQRARFEVSTEALLRRVVRLTSRAVSLFTAARPSPRAEFRVDYVVRSRAWAAPISSGDRVSESGVLARCTAVGYSDHGAEVWSGSEVFVQAVGVPPYPGDTFPRIVGLIQPPHESVSRDPGIRYVRGDASQPRTHGPAIIAHIVNDAAMRWGGHGFSRALVDAHRQAADAYANWDATDRRFGEVHFATAGPDLWIASLLAQRGFGPTRTREPRVRVRALRQGLQELADRALSVGAEVHMPLIATGQGGMRWPAVRDLILEELGQRHVPVTVYLLPDAPAPDDVSEADQLALF